MGRCVTKPDLFLKLLEFQINREHQKPDKADAHNEADLTVFEFFGGFIDECVGTFNGFFAGAAAC